MAIQLAQFRSAPLNPAPAWSSMFMRCSTSTGCASNPSPCCPIPASWSSASPRLDRGPALPGEQGQTALLPQESHRLPVPVWPRRFGQDFPLAPHRPGGGRRPGNQCVFRCSVHFQGPALLRGDCSPHLIWGDALCREWGNRVFSLRVKWSRVTVGGGQPRRVAPMGGGHVRRPDDTARRYAEGDPLIREAIDRGKGVV